MLQYRSPTPHVLLWFVIPLVFNWVPLFCSGAIIMQVAQYPARIYTNAPPGVPVVQVTAYDNATGYLSNFQFEKKDDATHFKIGPDGMIKTAKVINYDVGRTFEFFVYALYDNKGFGSYQLADFKHVKVIVSMRNLVSPVFSNSSYAFPVYRYAIGDVVGQVSATDNDIAPYNRKFDILAEPPQAALNYLNVDKTGKIVLIRRIPESTTMLDLKVMAKDFGSPQRSGKADVIIDVIMVRHPKTFCLSATPTTTTLCWKNPMPERDFDGYKVTVRGAITREDRIPLISGHTEACYKLNGTQIGDNYVFRVKVDTNEFWYGDIMDLSFEITRPGVLPSCYQEKFSTCSFLVPCDNGGICVPNETTGSDVSRSDGDVVQTLDYSCRCQDGFSGYNCTVKDVCGSNPCGEFGSCTQVDAEIYQCQCQTYYFGDKCQHFDQCQKAPCMNEGSCAIHDDGNYTCQCLPYFSGQNCQNPDPCSPDPCVKGQGRCVIVSDDTKQCACNAGFYGEFCQHEDVCVTSQPCLNGAKCVQTPTSYICECPVGRMGKNCGLNDPCAVDPCQNGGTCVITEDGDYRCDCRFGHTGPECQEQLATACVGVNCNNGTCVTEQQINKCDCDKGYHGEFCTSYDICLALDNPCTGHSECRSKSKDGSNKFKTEYTCECQPEYNGPKCENTNFCFPKVCKSPGTCVNIGGTTYDCKCPNGEFNEDCSADDACTPNKCLNGGECQANGATDFLCLCVEEWIGDSCQAPNPCQPRMNPCKTGSNCTVIGVPSGDGDDLQYATSCQCPQNRIGQHCQLNNPCLSTKAYCKQGQCVLEDHAKNSATEEGLINYNELFKCECFDGYTGQLCDVKSCSDVICQSGGYCSNGTCVCPVEFSGDRCQIQIPECIDGRPLTDPKCACEGGEIKCSTNGCGRGEIEFFMVEGDTTCVNSSNVPMSAASSASPIIRVCGTTIYDVYSPTCDTRTHCSPTGVEDEACRYFSCLPTDTGCTKYAEEKLTCLDLKVKGDREWIKCAEDRLKDMQDLVNDPSQLGAFEVADLAERVVGEIDAAIEEQGVAQLALNVINGLSQVNVSVSREVERQNKTNQRLRGFLDSYTAKVNINNGSVTMNTTGFVVQATSLNASDNADDNELKFEPKLNSSELIGMTISLPKKLLESSKYNISKDARVQFIGYERSQLFTPNFDDTDDLITMDSDVIERQRVISASVTGVSLKNLAEPVRIELPAIEKGINHTCVFWEEENSTWSGRGVKTVYNPKTGSITCLSDHLTSFAVIMSPTPEALKSQIGLTYITYIGSGISLCCLFLTILTYGLFRCLYGEKSGKILLQLCTSLFLLNIMFLVGSIDVSGFSNDVCTAIAILLHYFVLSTLLWMLVEAIEMYRAIVTVFTKYERFYLLKRCLAGWGVPAVIVAATASVDIEYYGMNTVDEDGNDETQICFMTPGGDNIAYYTSLLAPACLVVLINTVVFILVVRVILRPRFQQQISNNTAPFTPAQVRGAFTVMFLLGVTWIFGPLAIGEAAIVFSYLFCISNSLQGCLIFVFRCLFNPEARLAWIQLYKTGTLKRRRGPIKSVYVDSSSSKDGHDTSSTTRRLSNSANMNLTTSTNYTSGNSSSMKLPLFRGTSGGIHAHPHQLHTTNGWHPNLNGMKRDNGYTGNGSNGTQNGSDCGISVSVSNSSAGGGGGGRDSRSGSSGGGSDLMDMNSIQSSKHDNSMEKADLKPCETISVEKKEPLTPDVFAGYSDDFTHL